MGVKVCKSLWKAELRRTAPFLDYFYDYSILSEAKPMPKSKKKPRPAWETLFDALKDIYLDIQCQALLQHTFETPVYCYEDLSATFINADIFRESYIGKQLKSKVDFVMKQNWKNGQCLKLKPKKQLENLIKELGKFQKPWFKVWEQDMIKSVRICCFCC